MTESIKGRLVILRHGQTGHNVQHLMTGQLDVPLSEAGEEQAREAGRLLSPIIFDKVYSSTLSRAFNTAALALKHAETQIRLMNEDGTWQIEQRSEIIEQHSGDFTGRNHKTDPDVLAWQRTYDTPLPGGESDRQVVERVNAFYQNEILPRMKQGETVLVVAHAGVLRAFDIVLGFEDIPEDGIWTARKKKRIPNATPLVVEFENGQITGSYHIDNAKELEAANQNNPPAEKSAKNPSKNR
jgi:2,3-bisphosphoglycerate-dependent phosphoglycerate mutase